MPRIQVNDKLSSRGRQHINLLVCPNRGILKFEGRSIPPALKVVNESYKKDGMWSHTTWDCEVAEGYLLLPYSQDFANGRYFGGRTWSVAVNELRTALNLGIHPHIGITDEMIVDAIRVYFRKDADALDSLDTAYTTAGDQVAELLEARRVLAEAKAEEAECMAILQQHTEAEQMLKEAEEIKERNARFAQALTFGKKASLAELQAIMADKG